MLAEAEAIVLHVNTTVPSGAVVTFRERVPPQEALLLEVVPDVLESTLMGWPKSLIAFALVLGEAPPATALPLTLHVSRMTTNAGGGSPG